MENIPFTAIGFLNKRNDVHAKSERPYILITALTVNLEKVAKTMKIKVYIDTLKFSIELIKDKNVSFSEWQKILFETLKGQIFKMTVLDVGDSNLIAFNVKYQPDKGLIDKNSILREISVYSPINSTFQTTNDFEDFLKSTNQQMACQNLKILEYDRNLYGLIWQVSPTIFRLYTHSEPYKFKWTKDNLTFEGKLIYRELDIGEHAMYKFDDYMYLDEKLLAVVPTEEWDMDLASSVASKI